MGFAGIKTRAMRAYWKSVEAEAGTSHPFIACQLKGQILGAPYFRYTFKTEKLDI